MRCDYKQDRRWKKTEHNEKSALRVCSRTIFKHFFLERKITRTEVSFRDGITLDWLLLSPALPMNLALTHARRIISNFITFCCFHGEKIKSDATVFDDLITRSMLDISST